VATGGDILGLEIAVDDGEFKARARTGLASRRVQLQVVGTRETSLLLAVLRAAIPARLVAIIALLALIPASGVARGKSPDKSSGTSGEEAS
jgi:hypothetical protein